VLFDRNQLSNAVQELAQLHFNTLYPTVWNWGYTLYPSEIAKAAIGVAVDPRPEAIGLQKRDMLAELVQQGHQHGMTVMPWFEFGFMTPSESELAKRHPDWLTQRQDGSQIWMEGIYPRVWLNPFHPEVQQFILNLILEMVGNYNIDGIQFDDHFGLPYEFGYDAFTIQLYQQDNPGKSPPSDPHDPAWIRWRANKITAFMSEVFRAVKASRDVLVTLSPNTYSFSYNDSLQDWYNWERQGLIEELVLQVYQNDLSGFIAELNTAPVKDARQHIPTAIGILTGLKDRTIPIRQVQEQVQAVRQQGLSGVSFFFYETMWNLSTESAESRKATFRRLFSDPLSRPSRFQS
jgi:uncharacterized lipoprotein YddW (UPF0748 family)